MMNYQNRFSVFILIFAAALSWFGCEEMVDPANTTDEAFTLYGLYNPTSDTQAVRVFPIEDLLEVTKPEPIDARVYSTNLGSGVKTEWQDSLIQYTEGTFGHVFWSRFRPEFEQRYRLEVVRSDGKSAQATTTVPPLTEPQVQQPDTLDFDLITPVFWPEAPNLLNIQVEYLSNVGVFYINYGAASSPQNGGRLVEVEFRRDTRRILDEARIQRISPVYINGVVIRGVVGSADWTAPGGVFNPEFLVEPGTLSNVTDGFGFVGAGYETSVFWEPSDAVRRYSGFAIREPQ